MTTSVRVLLALLIPVATVAAVASKHSHGAIRVVTTVIAVGLIAVLLVGGNRLRS